MGRKIVELEVLGIRLVFYILKVRVNVRENDFNKNVYKFIYIVIKYVVIKCFIKLDKDD